MRIIVYFGCNGTRRRAILEFIASAVIYFPAFNLQHFLLPQTPGLGPQSRQRAANEIRKMLPDIPGALQIDLHFHFRVFDLGQDVRQMR